MIPWAMKCGGVPRRAVMRAAVRRTEVVGSELGSVRGGLAAAPSWSEGAKWLEGALLATDGRACERYKRPSPTTCFEIERHVSNRVAELAM